MKWLKFNPKQCIGCLACMTVENQGNVRCRSLIDMVRRGGPKFGYEDCAASECTKCVDICGGRALMK